ncbi:hypothetical protein AS026_30930 [Rhizobium altiplani]|uniref:Uncharacterized protein n=1 Tax=Rhizobium altiplani TaxID=1864509 RepID=A0A109JYZ9_9HYPH|nr:hypothetical protein AS026_30930 [Rhizobium altiplani]
MATLTKSRAGEPIETNSAKRNNVCGYARALRNVSEVLRCRLLPSCVPANSLPFGGYGSVFDLPIFDCRSVVGKLLLENVSLLRADDGDWCGHREMRSRTCKVRGSEVNLVCRACLSAIKALSGQPAPEQAHDLRAVDEGVVAERVVRRDRARVDDRNAQSVEKRYAMSEIGPIKAFVPAESQPENSSAVSCFDVDIAKYGRFGPISVN